MPFPRPVPKKGESDMFKEISVGDKLVPMLANAATPYRFKQIFHKDLLKIMFSTTAENESEDDVQKLAYVMSMQAAKRDLTQLNEETYIDWLEQFDPLDIFMASDAVMKLYQRNKFSDEIQKKTASDRQDHDDAAVPVAVDTDGSED